MARNVVCVVVLLALAAAAAPAPSEAAPPVTRGSIERFDPRLDELIAPDASLELIADGFHWVEGPVWDKREGCLYFSDIPANAVYRWRQGEGTREYLRPAGYTGLQPFEGREPGSNGLAIDSQGRLILCEHGDRRVRRLEKDGSKTTLADRYLGKRLNSPNDCALRSDGTLCFTDPPFGLRQAFDDPAGELEFCGVYCVAPDGSLALLTRELRAPNGLAFSPKEDVLYVSNADRNHPVWMAYAVSADGGLDAGRVFASAARWIGKRAGGPDGIKVDQGGHVFAAGPGGVYVLSPDGTHLGTIVTNVATSNCAFGEDGSALFIAASTSIYRIRTSTQGVDW